jgi:peptidoglycan/LPS O-acetylase OafA/YrhL
MVAVFHMLAVGGLGFGGSGVQIYGRPAQEVFGSWVFFAASYFWVGVPLFFMISGFVICMSG